MEHIESEVDTEYSLTADKHLHNRLLHELMKSFISSHENPYKEKMEPYSIHLSNIISKSKYENIPAGDLLSQREIAALEKVESFPIDVNPASDESVVIILKTTRLCNLRCTYCHSWAEGPGNVMSFESLAKTIRQSLSSPNLKHVEFVWHGGEATLLGAKYYKKMLWLQHRYCPDGVLFTNSLQTNAIDISDEMLDFIVENNISVGVSSDGPSEASDRKRVDKSGRGTSAQLEKTLAVMKSRGISFGLLSVIDREIASRGPHYMLEYYSSIGASSADLLNVIPENNDSGNVVGEYIPFSEFVEYLCDFYKTWSKTHRSKLTIRTFKSLEDRIQGLHGGACEFAGNCQGKYLTIEANGVISACDKYIGDNGYTYGNINEGGLFKELALSANLKAARQESSLFQENSSRCEWQSVCSGGCPHDRKITDKFSKTTHNCCGWRPLIELIASDLDRKPPAAC